MATTFCWGELLALSVLVIGFQIGAAQVCPFGWIERPNSDTCYLLTNVATKYRFSEAVDKCQSYEAELPIINSQNEKTWLLQQLHNITAARPNVKSWWLGMQYQTNRYQWVDGTTVDNSLVPWASSLPGSSKGPCVFVSDQQANIIACNQWNQLICERNKSLPLSCDVDNKWKFINGSCFKLFFDQRTWEDAKSLCELQDANLAKLATFAEHADLYDDAWNAKPQQVIWTGLNVQQSDQLQLTWLDDTVLNNSDTFWSPGQPVELQQGLSMAIDGTTSRRLYSWILDNDTAHHGYACQKAQGVCETGWLTHQNKCFKIFNQNVMWNYANFICSRIGGSIIKLASPSDQSFILRYFPQMKAMGQDSFWIGISDFGNDTGPLKWLDGSEVGNSSNWAQAKPPSNSIGHRDCGYVNTNDPDGHWQITTDCLQLRTFVCSIPVNTPVRPMPTLPTPTGHCPNGWYLYSGICYYFPDGSHNWRDARKACIAMGADLPLVKDDDVQSFLNGHLGGVNRWIGMNDFQSKGVWVWVDGTPLSGLLHWAKDEPNSEVPNEDCVFMWGEQSKESQSGQWNDAPCQALEGYTCQKPATRSDTTLQPTTPTTTSRLIFSRKCGINWEERPNSDYCYQYHDELKIHADAVTSCLQQNGTLVSITDYAEQSYLAGRARFMMDSIVWIGATDSSLEGGWTWMDGAPFAYINWNPGEPNDSNQTEDCAAMSTATSRWNDFDCRLQLGFICKKIADTYIPSTKRTVVTTPLPANQHWTCSSGYIGYNYQCYGVNNVPRAWSEANAACLADGAQLVSLGNQQENSFVYSILPIVTCSNIHGKDEDCVKWAKEGECEKNPVWMRKNCRDACSKCNDLCTDRYNHHQCSYWAALNECKKNPIWMMANCAQSCQVCDAGFLSGFWLGLSDRQVKGHFTWSDSTSVTFTNWHSGMPRSFPASSCVLMNKGGGGSWANNDCGAAAKYVCKKPMTISAITSMSPFQVGCSPRSLGLDGKCYSLAANAMSWKQAETYCSLSHGHLATINSMSIQAFVMAELDPNAASHYWIGLSNAGNTGTYTWSSGDDVLYTAWNSNHTGNEQSSCVAMQTTRPIGLWQNLNCSVSKAFVCEYPRKGYTTTTLATTTVPLPCPGDWLGFTQNCYKAFTDFAVRKTWSNAREFCRGYGGDLASVHSNDVNNFFQSTLLRNRQRILPRTFRRSIWIISNPTDYWIGLSDLDVEATYVWSDGSPVEFTKWYSGEPNNHGGIEDCAEYSTITNSWNDNSCFTANAFICSIPRGKPLATTLSPPTTTPVATCDGTEWLSKDGYCYYVSPLFGTDALKSWFEARRFCQTNGADLASIQSEDVTAFLVEFLSTQQALSRQYWIGLNELGGGNYQWSDGSPVVFTTWEQAEPNDAFGGQSCANLNSANGKWSDDNCNDQFHFICKRRNSTTTPLPPVPTPLIAGGCPPGFSGVGNNCFMVTGLAEGKALNYSDARDACRAIQARHPVDIASISNYQQQAFLVTLLEGVNSSVFIGFNDIRINQNFVWQDNQEVTVTYWAPNQPSQIWQIYGIPREDCVVMLTDEDSFGLWDDVFCGTPRGYICKTMKDTTYEIISPGTGGCKDGYYHYRDSCYGTYKKTPATWNAAENTCIADGGHLVSLRDIHELAQVNVFVIQDVVIQDVWIGLQYYPNTGEYSWLDGWPVTLTQWASGDPDKQANESCVKMLNGVWNDTTCDEIHPYVCKISSATPPPTTLPPPGYCADPSWAKYGDYCYYAAPQALASWPEARYFCQKMGMELLSLRDASEQAFVQNLVSQTITTPPYSYGLIFSASATRVWLGLQRTLEGGFRWTDGTPSDFFNWNDGEPNNHLDREDCVELQVDTGKWNDMPCVAVGTDRAYICKTPKLMPTSVSSTTSSTPSTTTASTTTLTTTIPRTQRQRPTAATRQTPFRQASKLTTSGTIGVTTSRLNPGPTQHYGKMTLASTDNQKNSTLSGGQTAGIVIGLLGLLLIVTVIVFVIRRRKFSLNVETADGFENVVYYNYQQKDELSLASNGSAATAFSNGSSQMQPHTIRLNHSDC